MSRHHRHTVRRITGQVARSRGTSSDPGWVLCPTQTPLPSRAPIRSVGVIEEAEQDGISGGNAGNEEASVTQTRTFREDQVSFSLGSHPFDRRRNNRLSERVRT